MLTEKQINRRSAWVAAFNVPVAPILTFSLERELSVVKMFSGKCLFFVFWKVFLFFIF
jgi:hypothetical protein